MTRLIAGLSGLALAILVMPAPAIALTPDLQTTDFSAARTFHGKRHFHPRKAKRFRTIRRYVRTSRHTFGRHQAARYGHRARQARLHAWRYHRRAALRHRPAIRRSSVSTAGLPRPLVAAIHRVQAACPGFRVISAFRPGARIRGGSGRLSLHARHRAADIAGGNYRCAYRVLAGFPGGMSTDAGRVKHIHLSWEPGGREWGLRFAHGGHRRYARHARRYAMTWR